MKSKTSYQHSILNARGFASGRRRSKVSQCTYAHADTHLHTLARAHTRARTCTSKSTETNTQTRKESKKTHTRIQTHACAPQGRCNGRCNSSPMAGEFLRCCREGLAGHDIYLEVPSNPMARKMSPLISSGAIKQLIQMNQLLVIIQVTHRAWTNYIIHVHHIIQIRLC